MSLYFAPPFLLRVPFSSLSGSLLVFLMAVCQILPQSGGQTISPPASQTIVVLFFYEQNTYISFSGEPFLKICWSPPSQSVILFLTFIPSVRYVTPLSSSFSRHPLVPSHILSLYFSPSFFTFLGSRLLFFALFVPPKSTLCHPFMSLSLRS